ncbi:chymotrypsin BI [Culex quinquefasciatus]|uniref:Chymotrypsin BI n=1 Tax=Culex quinquefasciatus TaxID=7176 RepID=B0W3X4_CULQU|nr:chymotrypsin BI [Culex quinquefasciatus]|eukprot:XP_001843408.1 chymotrypsin BI [Culex quinquefasciatus]
MKTFVLIGVLLVVTSAVLGDPLQRGNRIYNGQAASPGQFPYAVGIAPITPITARQVCGGSLVSANFVLTAGRCVHNIERVNVVLGALRIFEETEPTRLQMESNQFVIHSGFEQEPEIFDVALVRLPQAAPIGGNIGIIRLPNRRQVEATFVGQQGTVIGWGTSGTGTTFADQLQFARSQVISQLACRLSLPATTILDEHVCTEGSSSPCAGDYGGPLTITDIDGITTQIGVFSFNSVVGCAQGRAAVYTRMSSYLNWIGQNSDVVIRDDF